MTDHCETIWNITISGAPECSNIRGLCMEVAFGQHVAPSNPAKVVRMPQEENMNVRVT